MSLILLQLFSLLIFHSALGEICKSPKVEQNTYTTTDGMVVSEVALISEISVSCTPYVKELALYAEKSGKSVPAVKSPDNLKYQFSWTENAEQIFSGEHGVKVYDEEGYAAIRKAQRNSEDASSIPSAFFLSLYHRGTYYGPMVSTEFIAAATSMVLWYIAFTQKANLCS
ncbi:translocon-associated protein subunit delta [Parasteatoda tepidariorum]|uniref:translocon-associated protein subunit delta n=1 Tax=Parasteatoda tepidariorum TaxID=114398 RepID=UPI00077FD7F0|nr:translocon-associated protein subunit delta [Parasteatoda tepidariorum]